MWVDLALLVAKIATGGYTPSNASALRCERNKEK